MIEIKVEKIFFPAQKKTPRSRTIPAFFCSTLARRRLALRELRLLARLTQTNLLTLNFTRVTSDETRLTQRRLELLVVLHQCASNSMPNSAGLPEATTTANCDIYVEFLDHFHEL